VSKRGRGRPPGKHSDPNYTLVGAYVRRSVCDAVKKRLTAGKTEFSQLVEQLLSEWLARDGAGVKRAEEPTEKPKKKRGSRPKKGE